jgi:hypothetical protein
MVYQVELLTPLPQRDGAKLPRDYGARQHCEGRIKRRRMDLPLPVHPPPDYAPH